MGYWHRVAIFDIIIPAYNAARFLPAAIESVMAQTFTDWRIVLVDDGSTDFTSEIAARYGRQLGDRMTVVTQKNAGLPAARNAALRIATAEYLAILDADDVWLPCRLQESLDSLTTHPNAGLSYGLIARMDEEGGVLETFSGNPTFAEGGIAPYIYMRKVELPCPTITLRREVLAKVGLFDETMLATEDRDMWLRVAQCYDVAFVPKVISYYRMSANSMSADMDRMMRAQFRFIDKHFGTPGCGRIARRIGRARVWKQRGELFRERGQDGKAFFAGLRAALMWPLGTDNLRTFASLAVQRVRRG